MHKKKLIPLIFIIAIILTGCGLNNVKREEVKQPQKPVPQRRVLTKEEEDSLKDYEMTEEEMEKILDEIGYGEGVDWSKQTDDDPNIPKNMDVTSSIASIKEAYIKLYSDKYEPGDSYDKAWWEYIPETYDLTRDVFPKTDNYAGEEKEYNNSLEQQLLDCYEGYTTGQAHDLDHAKTVAHTFIYEAMKDKYQWTDDLDSLCKRADSLDIADFYSKQSERPLWHDANQEWQGPGFMTAYYNNRIVGYDRIGLPQFGGYQFNITVWEKCDELVGWQDDMMGTGFYNEDEVYENMGEWDFYDELNATDNPKKLHKPKLPNGAMMLKGKTNNLSNEQYFYSDVGMGSGIIYYYGNGITVEMTFYGSGQGGSFKDGLEYCRYICRNK